MITVEGRRRAGNAAGYESGRFSGHTYGDAERKAEEWGATNILHSDGTRLIRLQGEWFRL